MKIEWDTELFAFDAVDIMQTAADAAMFAEGINVPCAINVILTDDTRIHQINLEHRGVDAPTDVLSFPAIRYKKGLTLKNSLHKLKTVYDDQLCCAMLGDIVISLPMVLKQADEYGNSAARESAYMMVHAIMHLMGYDHMNDFEQKEMRLMEEKALGAMGLSDTQPVTDEALVALAHQAKERAYVPYSKYSVGAALLCQDGRVYQGCNVENASYGLTNCAERTAVFKAVSDGAALFTAIAIAADGSEPWPCGACRQVMNEFAPDLRVIVSKEGHPISKSTLAQLLPHGFGPKDLP